MKIIIQENPSESQLARGFQTTLLVSSGEVAAWSSLHKAPSKTSLDGRSTLLAYNGNNYFCIASVALDKAVLPSLVSIVHVDRDFEIITLEWLQQSLNMLSADEVASPDFLSSLCVVGAETGFKIDHEADGLLEQRSVALCHLGPKDYDRRPAQGPHLFYQSILWQACKQHHDSLGAFQIALTPPLQTESYSALDADFRRLDCMGNTYQTLNIAVPSRLVTARSPARLRLAGMRFAVKDLYRMKGLKNSLCNKAYLEVDEFSDYTAPAIAVLIKAGALPLGMTKLSSLISREEPSEAVDYQLPFNPRGDRYQSPAGSSNGSAAAVASYTWLDFAVGTDTSGSGRRPALVNGVFQLRPTHNAISSKGLIPTFPRWDTPCLFARDLTIFDRLAPTWYAFKAQRPCPRFRKPPALIFPVDFFKLRNETQLRIIRAFLKDLGKFLKVKIRNVSISALWDSERPAEAHNQHIEAYLEDTVVHTYYHDFYHSTDDFRKKYHAKHGKNPYVTPYNRWRWNLGKNVSPEQYREGIHRLNVYKQWFLDHVMMQRDFESFLVLPVAEVEPNYRDSPAPTPCRQSGFDSLFVPPILGAPDIFVPLGECKFDSEVSGKPEYLPVGLDVVGLPGEDFLLMDTIRDCLRSSNRPTKVVTGPRMFEGNTE